jgi:hypothetical protein
MQDTLKSLTDKFAALCRVDSAVWSAIQANDMFRVVFSTDLQEFYRSLLMQQVSAHRTFSLNPH